MNVRGASFYEERGCIRSENRQFSNKRCATNMGEGKGEGGGGGGCHSAQSLLAGT